MLRVRQSNVLKMGLVTLSVAVLVGFMVSGVQGQPVVGGTLVVGRPIDSITLDPHTGVSASDTWVYSNMYDTLTRLDERFNLQPCLATSWERVEPTVWRFHLRKGVTYHDGTPFNAEAVKFVFDRAFGRLEWPRARMVGFLGPIKEVKAVDQYTVDFVTQYPYTPLPRVMSMHWGTDIYSPTAVRKWGDKYGSHPVGTGPFKFAKWVAGSEIVLERNEDYWGEKPYVDRVVFKVIPEDAARTMALETGEIDILTKPSPEDIPGLKANPDIQVFETETTGTFYFGCNFKNPPLNNKKLRQIFAYAIDTEAINAYILRGMTIPGVGLLPPMSWAWKDTGLPKRYGYDPTKVARLLAAEGWKDRDADKILEDKEGNELKVVYFSSAGRDIKDREIAVAIAQYLRDVGIKVDHRHMQWGTFISSLRTKIGEYNIWSMGWHGLMSGDPDQFLYPLTHSSQLHPKGYNRAQFVNVEVSQLLDKARTVEDEKERAQIYGKAQDILIEELPYYPIYNLVRRQAIAKHVKGFTLHQSEYKLFLDRVWLSGKK
jgi:peptide/nickel transport system substrate-binding protein